MPTVVISSNNFDGQIGNITYYPYTGNTPVYIGPQLLPYYYTAEYVYGTYEVYFSGSIITCNLTINPPTLTPTKTPTITPTVTQTQTPTQTQTSTNTPTQTSTNTPTQTSTPTNTSTQTQTPTKTSTQTQTPTQTPTQTRTQTPSPTGYPPENAFFIDCCPSNNTIQIFNLPFGVFSTLVNGSVYYITNASYTGCATFTTSITSAINNYSYVISDTITLQTDCPTCLSSNSIICLTQTPTPTKTQTPTPTQTNTQTNTQTLTRTNTPTQTNTPTSTVTQTPTTTITKTPTQTNTITPTKTQTLSSSITPTQTPTTTPTKTPTQTQTPTQTTSVTPTQSITPTKTTTQTNTQTNTQTQTNTSTNTPTQTPTQTTTPTVTPTVTSTIAKTPDPTLTQTQTPTVTSTFTPTVTQTPPAVCVFPSVFTQLRAGTRYYTTCPPGSTFVTAAGPNQGKCIDDITGLESFCCAYSTLVPACCSTPNGPCVYSNDSAYSVACTLNAGEIFREPVCDRIVTMYVEGTITNYSDLVGRKIYANSTNTYPTTCGCNRANFQYWFDTNNFAQPWYGWPQYRVSIRLLEGPRNAFNQVLYCIVNSVTFCPYP